MDESRDFPSKGALRLALLRLLSRGYRELRHTPERQEREVFEEADHIVVCGFEPKLIHIGCRRARRNEPHGVALGLAELAAIAFGDERQREAEGGPSLHAANQIDPGRDVAPLVTAAHLRRAVVSAEQAQA